MDVLQVLRGGIYRQQGRVKVMFGGLNDMKVLFGGLEYFDPP